MPIPAIVELLEVQEADAERASLAKEMEAMPLDIAAIERKIERERQELLGKAARLKELEVERKLLEGTVSSAEEKIFRFKNQQLQVKKNEEYTALENEIAGERGTIDESESRLLEVMMALDEEQQLYAEHTKKFEVDKREHEERIEEIRAQLARVTEKHDAAKAFFEGKLEGLEGGQRELYERLASRIKRFPYVAEIVGHTCQGCHVRLSNMIYEEAVKGQLTTCESCGRTVYLP
ncbi:MAG: zinc ribbon domain-containing protein [Puniceicoccaceae bacterium]